MRSVEDSSESGLVSDQGYLVGPGESGRDRTRKLFISLQSANASVVQLLPLWQRRCIPYLHHSDILPVRTRLMAAASS